MANESKALTLSSYGPRYTSNDIKNKDVEVSLSAQLNSKVKDQDGKNAYGDFYNVIITKKVNGDWDNTNATKVSLVGRKALSFGKLIKDCISATQAGTPYAKGVPTGANLIEITNGGKLGIAEGQMAIVIYNNLDPSSKRAEKYEVFTFPNNPLITNYSITSKGTSFDVERDYGDIEYLADSLIDFGIKLGGGSDLQMKRSNYFALRPLVERQMAIMAHMNIADPILPNSKAGGGKAYEDWSSAGSNSNNKPFTPSTSDALNSAIAGIGEENDDDVPF